jgi:hypothetical protein
LALLIYLRRVKKEASLKLLITKSLWPMRRVIKETINTLLRDWSGSYNNNGDGDNGAKV